MSALLAFYLATLAVAVLVVLPLQALGVPGVLNVLNWVLLIPLLGGTAVYLALSVRAVYTVPAWRAWVGATLATTLGLVAVVTVYRVLLFWLTLWTLDLPPA